MLLTKEVEIKWHHSNKKHYESKGYIFTKYKDKFNVNIEDLLESSQVNIQTLCDYCLQKGIEKICNKIYSNYIRDNKNGIIHKDCCINCKNEKTKESNLLIYGVTNVNYLEKVKQKKERTFMNNYGYKNSLQSPDVQEKIKQTNLLKYGVENPLSNKDIIQKRKETNLIKYGVENCFQNLETQNKIKETNIEKYGVDNPLKNSKIRDKMKSTNLEKYGDEIMFKTIHFKEISIQTCLDKYGVENYRQTEECTQKIIDTNLERYGCQFPIQNNEIKEKMLNTLYKNGNQKCSTQQNYLNNLLNGELNFPVNNCSLDIAFPEENIYIEYQGSGHDLTVQLNTTTQDEFNKKERKRYYFLKAKGWNFIEIISRKDYLPQDEILLLMIDYAKDYLSTGHSWITFDIDNYNIKTSQFSINVNYGQLRKIRKIA